MLNLRTNKPFFNKGLFLIIGESFRKGNQFTRVRGIPESFAEQQLASVSHVDLITHLENVHKTNIDVILNSYTTQYNKDIEDWYGHRLIKSVFHLKPMGWPNIYNAGIDLINNKQYDFIFIHRVDLYFKKYMKTRFDPTWKKISFATTLGDGRVNDVMVFVPRTFFDMFFDKKLCLCHEFLAHHSPENVCYFIDTHHDSDSFKEWNPLYRIINRDETLHWRSVDPIYNYRFPQQVTKKHENILFI